MAAMSAGAMLAGVSGLSREKSPSFIGAERCKLCHRAIYQRWSETPHATATSEPVTVDPACQTCHTTDGERLPGVQCEACHGPGANYWPAEVMMDPEKAMLAGLVPQSRDVCRRCHQERGIPEHEGELVIPTSSEFPRFIH